MFKKLLIIGFVLVLVAAVLFFAIDGMAEKEEENKSFTVERGSIIDKALAVGRIEPKQEISVKSKISGIVRTIYVDIGDKVQVGDPLFDVAPDPTPLEYAEAKRSVEIHPVSSDNALSAADRAPISISQIMPSRSLPTSISSTLPRKMRSSIFARVIMSVPA